MELVHTVIRYPPAIGGVERYVQQMCEGLVNRGHTIRVYTSDLDQHTEKTYLKEFSLQSMKNGVQINRLHALFLPFIKGYPVLPSLPAKLLTESVDLFHGHCFYYSTADITAFASRAKKRPFIYNPYFYISETKKWRLYRETIGHLSMSADVVICISEYEKQLIERSGFSVKRFEIVSPGINLDEYYKKKPPLFEKYGVDLSQNRILLFVGRIAPEKGVDVLIKAFSMALMKEPDLILAIVGPDGGERQAMLKLIDQFNCMDKIVFTGVLGRKELIAAYQEATLFVFPSRYEAFGIVLIEAMAAGLPIVASNAAALPFVVPDQSCGLLSSPGDSRSLARNIVEVIRDHDLQTFLSANASEHVSCNYNLSKQVILLEAIYKSILSW